MPEISGEGSVEEGPLITLQDVAMLEAPSAGVHVHVSFDGYAIQN